MEATRQQILETAVGVTCGPREKEYGPPNAGMAHTAAVWSAFLGGKLSAPLTGSDVAWMLAMLKAVRAQTSPGKRDNYVDGAAYVAIAGECAMPGVAE